MSAIHAVAAHRGHGNVLIKVFSQAPENFSCYEVQIATDAAGPYSFYNNFQFFSDVGNLADVPLEITIYMRIRYMTTLNGINSFSDWYQVRRGVLSTPSVIMEVKTIKDSRIGKNAAFPCQFRGQGLIAFTTPTELILR